MTLQVEDAGEYVCAAHNDVGDTKTSIMNVTVKQIPTFVSKMTSQIVRSGATVSFDCQTAATEEVTYTWIFNGRVLPPNGELEGWGRKDCCT